MTGRHAIDKVTTYEIRVAGLVAPQWADYWFEGLTITAEGEEASLLQGPLVDQGALLGLLAQIHNLGLCLLSVYRVAAEDEPNVSERGVYNDF